MHKHSGNDNETKLVLNSARHTMSEKVGAARVAITTRVQKGGEQPAIGFFRHGSDFPITVAEPFGTLACVPGHEVSELQLFYHLLSFSHDLLSCAVDLPLLGLHTTVKP